MSIEIKHVENSAKIGIENFKSSDIFNGTYYTHDNGGRPYQVVININNIQVFNNENKEFILEFDNPEKVFIGESPETEMTKYSGGYGNEFIGNSILVKTKDNTYYFIGHNIFKFSTEDEIIKYVSEVGNNDVPYPYAIDSKGRYYLMIEDIILEKISDEFKEDPYNYYYQKDWSEYTNIIKFVAIDNDEEVEYNFQFQNNPKEHYHSDWMKNLHAVEELEHGKIKKYPLSENDYVQIMKNIATKCGFKNLEKILLNL